MVAVVPDTLTGRRRRAPAREPRPRGRGSLAVRVVLALAVIAGAYHYSLRTLTGTLSLQTPLAYLGLVPFLALGLAAVRGPAAQDEPAIHDRQLDYIVGVPLLGLAVAMLVLLPARLSSLFWVWRVDLLSLPFFAAGVVAILFGVRAMWRLRLAIAFLFLAWPLPYLKVLDGLLEASTAATVAGVKAALAVAPVADAVGGSDGSLFAVHHGGKPFVLSVASACAGVNGVVGFLLVGAAFAVLVRGPRRRKAAWLGCGIVVLWVLNVARIIGIFAAGRRWGERVALDVFHPVVGMLTFGAGVLVMILAMPVFRLRVASRARPGGRSLPAAPARLCHVPGRLVAPAVVAAVALLASSTNATFRQFDLIASPLGEARLVGYTERPASFAGWSRVQYAEYRHQVPFFGADSRWLRHMYFPQAGGGGAPAPVVVDVLSTSDRKKLAAFGLEECYRFHGYRIRDLRQVPVGAGLTGTAISFYDRQNDRHWTTLHWEWPVRTPSGTRYERVVLMLIDAAGMSLAPPPAAPDVKRSIGGRLDDRLRSRAGDEVDADVVRLRDYLVGFGRAAVAAQTAVEPSGAVSS